MLRDFIESLAYAILFCAFWGVVFGLWYVLAPYFC